MSVLTHSTTSKTNWDFDPRSIPDCDIWFDAADTSTLGLHGTTVKTWQNKGSLAMNAIEEVGTVTSGNTINGNNYLTFPVTSQMAFTCAISSATTRSWFIVMRATTQINTSTAPQFIGPINATTSTQDSVIFTRASNTGYIVYQAPNGNGTNMIQSNTLPNPFNTVSQYTMVHSAATSTNYIGVNGTSYTPNVVNGVAAGYSTASVKYVINTSGYNTGSDICEIIHYNRDVSRAERVAIEGYLMWKWGIKRQNEVGFIPTSIGGCLAWFDADVNYADATSRATNFTFSTGDSIQSWRDKSGFGRDATFYNVSPSTTRPVLTASQVAGKTAVIFNGSNVLNSTLSLPTTSPITVFLVAASTGLGAFRAALTLNANPGTRGSLLSIYQPNSNVWWFSGGSPATDGNTASIGVVSGRYDILANYWNTTLRTQMNINGHHVQASTSSPTSLRANSTTFIGGSTSGAVDSTTPIDLWVGGIAEIILYTGTLTADQRNQVERYLSLKWNRPLVNACALSHPNKWVPDFARTFVPTDISTCRLWLDAADRSTITLSGSTVSQWRDKSGNNLHMTGRSTSGTATIATEYQNGLDVLNCTGNTIYEGPAGSAVYPLDCYIVIALKTLNRRDVFAITAPSPTDNFNSLTFGEHTALRWHNGSTNFNRTPLTVSPTDETSFDFLIMNWSLANGNYVIRRNGVQLSSTASYTFTLTANSVFQIGFRQFGSPSGLFLDAYIAEIVVYSNQLGSGDRQRIEGYLASKWNLRGNVPSTHPVYYPIPTASTIFNPFTISGCSLWLDGADSSSASMTLSGSNITQWIDKSGNALIGTAFNNPQLISNGLNGRSVVQFTSASSQYIDFGDANDMFTNQLNIFVVCNFTSTTGDGSIIAKSIAADGNGRYALIRETGVIRPIIGLTGSANNAGWTNNSTAVRLLRMTWTRSTVTLHENGTSVFSVALSNSSLLNNTHKLLVGGYLNSTGTAPLAGLYFNGRIMEILMYQTTLTTANVATIENYLADKWGLHTSAQVTAPSLLYNPQISDTINFNPATSLSGCRMWIDAADTATINSGTITAGANVTSLTDKSGTGLTLTLGGTPVWNYLLTKLPTINLTAGRFTGSFPSVITNFAHTCFIVTQLNSNPTAGFPCFGIANAATSPSRTLRCLDWATTIRTVGFFGAIVPAAVITAPANGTPFLWSCVFNGVNPLSAIYNSGSLFNISATTAVSPGANASHFSIGCEAGIGSGTTNTWPGHVSEIILYDRVLSNVDRIRVEKYLARKWGLTQSILAANRFTNPATIPDSPRILPTTFADIALWLDAADPDADGLLPATGTRIGSWTDKSGNSRTCVQITESQKPTLISDGGVPALLFEGSQFLVGTPVMTSTNYGIFIVARTTRTTTSSSFRDTVFFARKATTASAENFILMSVFGRQGLLQNREMWIVYTNAATPTNKRFLLTSPPNQTSRVLMSISDNSVTTNSNVFFLNGALQTASVTGSTANIATDAEGYRIGVANFGGVLSDYLQGVVYEVIVMLRLPTEQERQFLEGYLTWKWGINTNMPSSHPYRKISP